MLFGDKSVSPINVWVRRWKGVVVKSLNFGDGRVDQRLPGGVLRFRQLLSPYFRGFATAAAVAKMVLWGKEGVFVLCRW